MILIGQRRRLWLARDINPGWSATLLVGSTVHCINWNTSISVIYKNNAQLNIKVPRIFFQLIDILKIHDIEFFWSSCTLSQTPKEHFLIFRITLNKTKVKNGDYRLSLSLSNHALFFFPLYPKKKSALHPFVQWLYWSHCGLDFEHRGYP